MFFFMVRLFENSETRSDFLKDNSNLDKTCQFAKAWLNDLNQQFVGNSGFIGSKSKVWKIFFNQLICQNYIQRRYDFFPITLPLAPTSREISSVWKFQKGLQKLSLKIVFKPCLLEQHNRTYTQLWLHCVPVAAEQKDHYAELHSKKD